MKAAYGVCGMRAPLVNVAGRGVSGEAFHSAAFQSRGPSSKGRRGAQSRTGRGAAQAVAIATSIRSCPAVVMDGVDLQIVNLLSLGSSRAVIASLVGIGQGTVKRRILAMQAQMDAAPPVPSAAPI